MRHKKDNMRASQTKTVFRTPKSGFFVLTHDLYKSRVTSQNIITVSGEYAGQSSLTESDSRHLSLKGAIFKTQNKDNMKKKNGAATPKNKAHRGRYSVSDQKYRVELTGVEISVIHNLLHNSVHYGEYRNTDIIPKVSAYAVFKKKHQNIRKPVFEKTLSSH